jgi:hypothetical protein
VRMCACVHVRVCVCVCVCVCVRVYDMKDGKCVEGSEGGTLLSPPQSGTVCAKNID